MRNELLSATITTINYYQLILLTTISYYQLPSATISYHRYYQLVVLLPTSSDGLFESISIPSNTYIAGILIISIKVKVFSIRIFRLSRCIFVALGLFFTIQWLDDLEGMC
ncbi:hypothetical protein V8C43DRAFT_1193 [Trichoderma afarasin]